MLFHDPAFLRLFLAVYLVTLLLRRTQTARKAFLLAASLGFYMSWGPAWVLLLLGTSLVDFGIGIALDKVRAPGTRRMLLIASLSGNLGILAYFKYSGFFWGIFAASASEPGSLLPWNVLRDGRLLIPLGLSFYTFQTMGYVIDRYRGRIAVCRSPLDFFLYISFFPQLVAGPILRAQEFLPQLDRPPAIRLQDAGCGLAWVLVGLGKKVLLADPIGEYVDAAYASSGRLGAADAWIALYGFAAQIYCDFSGYSDIARGFGRMMGYRIARNFRRPYLAASPQAFWRRWHITLSEFLRDYLYIPLGGSRRGEGRALLALAATMTLGGLWHGPAWTFVLWGVFHGGLLIAHRLWNRAIGPAPWRGGLPWRLLCGAAMFHAVCLGWILFRAPDLVTAKEILMRLGRGPWGPPQIPGAAWIVGLLGLLVLTQSGLFDRLAHPRFLRRHPRVSGIAMGATAAFLAIVLWGSRPHDFIYFMF